MNIFDLFMLLGGLGLLIYGMRVLSEGLKNAAGKGLKHTLQTMAKHKFPAVLVGAAVTAVVQSSGVITVILIGLVNAGILSLMQAVCISMGANIGTTVTAQLIAFNFSGIAPLLLFIGVFMMFFIRNKTVKKIGTILAGAGMLFIGLKFMTDALSPLRDEPWVSGFFLSLKQYPLLAVLDGAVAAALLQSSSAVMGILQALALQGLLGLDSAAYMILGLNIGTCITALLAGIGLSRAAKQVAVANLLFNLLGAAVFILILTIAPVTLDWVKGISPEDELRQFANFHSIFNILSALLFLAWPQGLVGASNFFVKPENKSVRKINPGNTKPA